MGDVKRFGRIGDMVEATKGILSLYPSMSVYVRAEDFDAAQSELAAVRRRESLLKEKLADCEKSEAALREELAELHTENDRLLTVASASEHRNADMLNWLRRQANADKGSVAGYAFTEAYNALKKIADAKPTESGASE